MTKTFGVTLRTQKESEQKEKSLPRPIIKTDTTAVMGVRAKKIHRKSFPYTRRELAKLQENSSTSCCESLVILALILFVQSPQ